MDECCVVTGYGFRVMLSTRTGGEIPVFTGFYELFARDAVIERRRPILTVSNGTA